MVKEVIEVEGVKKQRKSTNVQFSPEQIKEIEVCLDKIGLTTITDFIKFSCKMMVNQINENGAIPFRNKGNKKIKVEKVV